MEEISNDNQTTNKNTYTEKNKAAIYKYRNKDIERYRALQRSYYEKNKQNPEWRQKFNERCNYYNKKYQERKRLEQSEPKRKRGRPRKEITVNIAGILEENLEKTL